jgi:hypothetical protein
MIGFNRVERIHPVCAQTKPKVPYILTNVDIEHSIDHPPLRRISGAPQHSIFIMLFAMPPQ